MATKIKEKPICYKDDCFQNKCGAACELLTEYPSHPCPFYKTYEQVETDRMKAHKKLIDEGRFDLVRKYEYNPYRGGQW